MPKNNNICEKLTAGKTSAIERGTEIINKPAKELMPISVLMIDVSKFKDDEIITPSAENKNVLFEMLLSRFLLKKYIKVIDDNIQKHQCDIKGNLLQKTVIVGVKKYIPKAIPNVNGNKNPNDFR